MTSSRFRAGLCERNAGRAAFLSQMPGREHELTLLLCQTAAQRARLASRIAALVEEVDWDALAVALQRHGQLAIGGERLLAAAGDAVPEPFRDRVARAMTIGRHRSVLLEAVTTTLLRDLAAAGIPALPLKGVMLGRRLYGDAGLRPSTDIDVLVARRDFRAAGEIVARRGYAAAPEVEFDDDMPNLHETFVPTGGDRPEVELHWRIHWYESGGFSERMLERSAAGEGGVLEPARADELAALLLFYQRDSFLGLKLAADVAAWWDAYGHELPDGALAPLAAEHPELRDALAASAAVVERVVGVPATRVMPAAPRRPRRADWAARLGDWAFARMTAQDVANLGLIDWLLTPPGGQRSYVRRYLLQPPRTFALTHGLPERPRARDHVRRVAHAAARTTKAATRLGLALWRIRGGGSWAPLPASLAERDAAPRKKGGGPAVVRACPPTSSGPSASSSKPTSGWPESPPSMTSEGEPA